MVYVIQVCWQPASRIWTEPVLSWSCSQAFSKPVWHISLLCVQWKTPDDGQRNCPKHVELASSIRMEPVPSRSYLQAVSKPVWHIPLLCVQWKTPDDGQRNCPKHVEFYSKNKFEKLVHLAGFIIRIYHDGRSPERPIRLNIGKEYFNLPMPGIELVM